MFKILFLSQFFIMFCSKLQIQFFPHLKNPFVLKFQFKIQLISKTYLLCYNSLFLKRFYLFIFRERKREGGRKGEKHQCVVDSHVTRPGTWPTTKACALTGN